MPTNVALCLLLPVLLFTCGPAPGDTLDGTVSTYWVNSSKVPCTGVGPQTCLQIKRGADLAAGDWEYFYSNIEDFDYEPGYLYRLSVRETPRSEAATPANASTIVYTLVNVEEKRPDPTLRLNDIWALETIAGEAVELGEDALLQQPTIEFQLAERRVGGTNGCNNFSGTLEEVGADALAFGPLAMTRKACRNNTVPDRITAALDRVAGYRIDGLTLQLLDAAGEPLLGYRKVD